MPLSTTPAVFFTSPYTVEVRDVELPEPAGSQLLVRTNVSGISAGTELLFYRNSVPSDMSIDSAFEGMSAPVAYPLRYGYSCAGVVVSAGPDADPGWIRRRVFAFQPHAGSFVVAPEDVLPLPQDLDVERAVFLPNMETALGLVMDAAPLIGERVVVFGQGVVGLLVTSLLAQMPLEALITVDPCEQRRRISQQLGATASLPPDDLMKQALPETDLFLELSGNPQALDLAVRIAPYGSRIIVGSWYGSKTASLALGGHFHRNHVTILSSQVSTIPPLLRGRWTKQRRLLSALHALERLDVSLLITHRIRVEEAARAYQILDQSPETALQVVLTY